MTSRSDTTASRRPRRLLSPRSSRVNVAALALILVTLGACDVGQEPASPIPGCPTNVPAGGGNAVVAVLTGIAAADQSEQLRSERMAAFDTVICAGFAMQSHLIGDVVGAGVSTANLWANAALVGEGPNGLIRRTNGRAKRDELRAAMRDAMDRPSAGAVDLLSALNVLHGHLTGLPSEGGVDVVVMSTMIDGTPTLRLDDAASLARSPYDLVENVTNLLPDCTGWRVQVVGGGRAPTGGLDATLANRLKNLWALVFHRCGGHLVAWDSELTTFPVADRPIAPPEPAVEVTEHPGAGVLIRIPGNVLFDTGVSALRPDADAAFTQALAIIGRNPDRNVRVAGFTDSVGAPDANQLLSEARADSVAAWLGAHGVARKRLTVVGFGAAMPTADNGTPEGRQANRRVEITLVEG